MDDPRALFLTYLNEKGKYQVDEYNYIWSEHIKYSIIEAMFYTINDYIRYERDNNNGIGSIEIEYNLYLENPPEDDKFLIMHIYDNISKIKSEKHKKTLMYLINILFFY